MRSRRDARIGETSGAGERRGIETAQRRFCIRDGAVCGFVHTRRCMRRTARCRRYPGKLSLAAALSPAVFARARIVPQGNSSVPNSVTNVRYVVRPAFRRPFDYRLTEPCDSITWRHRPRSGERGVSRDRYLGRPGVRPRLAPFTSPGSHSDSRPVSRGGVHVAMRTESCTGKRVFAARRGVALNAASGPGYAAFVARSLSVKLNSRGDSTRRYTSLAPPPPPSPFRPELVLR